MLDDKRIKEAESGVKSYLADGLLRRADKINANILSIFRKNSDESLKTADLLFKGNHSNLWIIVCSYYAMYYTANAVLYSMGYKVEHKISHKVTADALIVFVRNRLKKSFLEEFETAKDEALEIANIRANELVSNFDDERTKRSKFQYEMTEEIKRSKANTSLERAKRFIFEMEKLLIK